MARCHEDLAKTFTDEQKEIFEKFHDCRDEYVRRAEKSRLDIRQIPKDTEASAVQEDPLPRPPPHLRYHGA